VLNRGPAQDRVEMKVRESLMRTIERGKAHLTLIDPDEQSPVVAGKMAREAEKAGTDGIMVGGSTAEDQTIVDRTVAAIKQACALPTILFPGGVRGLTPRADAIFYISLLNSRDPYFITGAHADSAKQVRTLGLEVIPVGYIVVEPGQTVGRMGKASLIPRDRPERATAYALVAQFFGMSFTYLEAGSGADKHVPVEMVSEVRRSVDIPLIVGGGIRTVEDAMEVARAGADIIVQGTAMEEDSGPGRRVAEAIQALKGDP